MTEMYPALTPDVIEVIGASPDARLRDCVAPTLLAFVALEAEPAHGHWKADGYVIVRPEAAARFCKILVASVGNEIRQMLKRGTLKGESIGDGEWRVVVTDYGWERLDEAI